MGSKLTLTGASIGIPHTGISRVNGIIRSSGAIHDFVIFFASWIAAKESCISRLEIEDASEPSYTRFFSFSMFVKLNVSTVSWGYE